MPQKLPKLKGDEWMTTKTTKVIQSLEALRTTFDFGHTLLKEGQFEPKGFYVLEKGRVDILVSERKVAQLEAKNDVEFIGEVAAITNTRRTATVVTASLVQALWIPLDKLNQVLTEDPSLSLKLVRSVCTKLILSDKVHAAENQKRDISSSKKLLLEYMKGLFYLMQKAAKDSPTDSTKELVDYFLKTNPWNIDTGNPNKLFHLRLPLDTEEEEKE